MFPNAYANTMVGGGIGIGGTAPMSGYNQTPSTEPASLTGNVGASIDGTPVRVGTLVIGSLIVLAIFHFGKVKFNVAAGG